MIKVIISIVIIFVILVIIIKISSEGNIVKQIDENPYNKKD